MRYFGNGLRCAALTVILVVAAHAASACARNDVPVFLHFFDWFHEKSWQEDRFADKLDWQAIGVNGPDRSSEKFYFKQFEYIKSLGINALAWEYHPRRGMHATYPSPAAIRALKRSGLKIAPFYDLEIAFKLKQNSKMIGTLSNPDVIRPNSETVAFMTGQLKEFFAHVPHSLLATDKKGRQVNFVFGYGFDDRNPDPAAWSSFANRLVADVGALSKGDPVFYWTAKNSVFEEHLFLHHRDHFVPFQFVLDTPQSQFGHDSVTWNFGFDNQLVLKRDGLQRVVRLDPRYVQEMGWLSKAADPSLVFIYGWNEPFEGSLLLPTKHWGDTKARLAEEYLRRLRFGCDPPLPKTLLIVDDLDAYWGARKGDWHLSILRDMLLYPMRRFAPQADVRMVSEITQKLLDRYPYIIDTSSLKSERVSSWLLEKMESHRIMVFDPLAESTGDTLARYFAALGNSPALNRPVELGNGTGKVFVHDDVNYARPCGGCGVKLTAEIRKDFLFSLTVPLVVTRGDDVWVNAYTADERVLTPAFQAFYGRPMNVSIMYGEGMASQRLEVDPKTKKVTYNRLTRNSIDGHWALPKDINWFRMPPGLGPEHYKFIFGMDRGPVKSN